MHGPAVTLVLVSAILHATWNAQLKGGRSGDHDRPQFMSSMSLVMGLLALLSAPFVPLPASSAWVCVAVSAALHIAYNLLLLQNYKMSDFRQHVPDCLRHLPLLVTLGAFLLMHHARLVGDALRRAWYRLRVSRDERALGNRHRPRVSRRSFHLAQIRFGLPDLLRGHSSGHYVEVMRNCMHSADCESISPPDCAIREL